MKLSSESDWRRLTFLSMTALAVLCIAWETWLAPVRPGAWALALKAAPILLALRGIATGHLRTYQWWSMLILAYLAEGLVRGVGDQPPSNWLAWAEVALAACAYAGILGYCRAVRLARA